MASDVSEFEPGRQLAARPASPSGAIAGTDTVRAWLPLASRPSHFWSPLKEAGLSPIWGGIRYPVDAILGARMGRGIGELAVARLERDGGER